MHKETPRVFTLLPQRAIRYGVLGFSQCLLQYIAISRFNALVVILENSVVFKTVVQIKLFRFVISYLDM